MVISSFNIWLVNALLVSRHVGFSFAGQLRAVMPPLCATVFAFVVTFVLGWSFNILSSWLHAVILLAVYLLTALLLRFRAIADLTAILSRL